MFRFILIFTGVTLVSSFNVGHAQTTTSKVESTLTKTDPYVFGKITGTRLIRDHLNVAFALKRSDGLHAGDRLVIIRPSAGNVVVDEVEVDIVEDRQSAGRCLRHQRLVEVGDVVVFQRTLNQETTPASESRTSNDLYAEITFWSPPKGETRTTFNARLERLTWEGLLDIRDVQALIYLDQVSQARMTIPAGSIKQLRLNGMVLVVDGPKKTLVAAAIHDYREVVRADAIVRERIELVKARIASEERIAIAAHQANSDAQVRIATARAQADHEAHFRLADLASRERLAREQIDRDYDLARERIVAQANANATSTANSNQHLSRALTAAGGLLQIAAYFNPKQAEGLNAISGGTAILGAIIN